MVNDGFTRVDFVMEGSRGQNLVEYTPEDLKYFDSLKRGGLNIQDGDVQFIIRDSGKSAEILKVGPLETFLGDNMFGNRNSQEGVIGKVARANQCNAYEIGADCLINTGKGQISAKSFRVYAVSN